MTLLQVVENAVKAVRHLRSLGCEDIEFSPEDAGRSDPKFLYRVLAAVIEAGATTLNIPDTTGGPLPEPCAAAARFSLERKMLGALKCSCRDTNYSDGRSAAALLYSA